MVQFVLDEEVDEDFSRMKTEETAQKAGQKVRAVTYHAASIRDHATPLLIVNNIFTNMFIFSFLSEAVFICCYGCRQL